MTKLSTIGLLSHTDGRLMGDIGTVYEVVSFFIGRDAYTHELPKYGRQIAPIIVTAFPQLRERRDVEWETVRDDALAEFGETIEVPDEWSGSLADGKNMMETLAEVTGQTTPMTVSDMVIKQWIGG